MDYSCEIKKITKIVNKINNKNKQIKFTKSYGKNFKVSVIELLL